MPKRSARPLLSVLTLILAATSAPGFAQQPSAWPWKPVTIVTSNVPGGGSDLESRIYAEKLAAVFGKPFLVESKPGASGTIAAQYVARAAPDGHTLLSVAGSFLVVPATETLPYDPLKDLAPVSMMTTAPTSLIAAASFPPNNMKEYIAYAKANPGKILWGTSGSGGSQHLYGVWLHDAIGAEATYVHYKGGTQSQTDLMAGRIHVQPRAISGPLDFIKSGKLKVIASLASGRDPLMPDVPTAQEAGIKDIDISTFYGLLATGGTDRAIVNRLSAELAKIAKLPDVRQKLEPLGNTMVGSTPEEFAKYISTKINIFKRLVKEKNIKVDPTS